MKKLTLLLPVLLCALTVVSAQAQRLNIPPSEKTLKKIEANITNAIAKARREHQTRAQQDQKHYCCACGQEITEAAQHCAATEYTGLCSDHCDKAAETAPGAYVPHCAACGEEIREEAQHCAATEYTGLCSVSPVKPSRQAPPADPAVCPVCGHAYTIDEKYHGVEHVCPVKQTSAQRGGNGGEPESEPVFIECGEPARQGMNGGEPETEYFVNEEESVQQANGGEPQLPGYTELDQEVLLQARKRLQADYKAHNGRAQHSLGYYYKQVLSEQKSAK